MYLSMVTEIENALGDADVKSKGEFVCKAIAFYLGYLRSQKENTSGEYATLAGSVQIPIGRAVDLRPLRMYGKAPNLSVPRQQNHHRRL